MPSVLVVGAGVSGLSAATFLAARGMEVQVLEAGAEAGGNVRTELVDGRTIDRAANGWLDSEPAMDRLLALLELGDATIRASDAYGTRWIFADGQLHPAPLSPPAMIKTRLLSWPAKLRMLLEPLMPRGPKDRDESVADFVGRRLGTAAVDRLVGPMVAGIHAADPAELSLASAFPRMKELETTYGSLVRAMLALKRGGAPPGHLCTLPGGAGALTARMADKLGDRLLLGAKVHSLVRKGDRWGVQAEGGDLMADAVLFACPAGAQARLLRPFAAPAADALAQIPYAPIAVIVTGWPEDAFPNPPQGFGALLARGEPARQGGVLGTVFSSRIFPQQGLAGEVLLRTMIGGSIAPEAVAQDDQALLGAVTQHLSMLFGEPKGPPSFTWLTRHAAGIPGYRPGHGQRVATVRAAERAFPGLFFAGNHLEGIGVKDCAREGEKAAGRVEALLGDPAS